MKTLNSQLSTLNFQTEIRARASLEKRSLTDAEKAAGYIGALTGVIPYNSDSVTLTKRGRAKPFVEQIAPDAFTRSLKEDRDIMANAGHTDDPLAALGRIGENLTVSSTATELRWEALLPDTQASRDVLNLVDKKIIRGTSFEFEVRGAAGEKWESRDAQTDLRTITDAKLIAFNPVTWPAYTDSSLTVEMRKRGGADERSYFLYQAGDYSYSDSTVTPDTAYAMQAIGSETCELTEALAYLRTSPAGALADYARQNVQECAASVKLLTDFLAASGATINPEAAQRAAALLKEAREKLSPENTVSAREMRLRSIHR